MLIHPLPEPASAMHLHLITIHVRPSPQAVPLAAAFLRASVEARFGRRAPAPVTVTSAAYAAGTAIETILAGIVAEQPQIVGFSLCVWNRALCAELVTRLRTLLPATLLLGGGPEATADPGGLLAEAPFDLLVVGEGEGTLVALLDRLVTGTPLDDLDGIARRGADGAIVRSSPPLSDLDRLPSPWLSGLLDEQIPRGVLWQLGRGCSFGCDFCFDGMGSRTVRRFSLERLAAELDYLVQHGAHQVFVLDSTFNQDLPRAKTLLKLIRNKARHVHFHFEVRHEFLDAESARLFGEIACSLQIGLQSAAPEVLQQVGRSFDRETFVRKIALLNEAGATFGFDLIYGLPGDSLARFRESLDFALGLYPNQLDIFPLAILPGTRLAARAEALTLDSLPHPPYTLTASPTFPPDDLALARRLGAACDLFYSRGKAVAWFNGVVAALKLNPAAFLGAFADWLHAATGREPDVAGHDDAAIWQLQRAFLGDSFARRGLDRLLPVALDFVDYHYHYAATVQGPAEEPARNPARLDLLHVPLRRTAGARLVSFHYDIDALLALGEPQLARCASRLKPVGSFALIYLRSGAVCTEALPEGYFRLLERLDGRTPAGRIAAELGIAGDEARKFLRIAAGEGIVTSAGMKRAV